MINADEAVLAALREAGPGTITVKQLAERAGVARVTARVSVASLALDGLVCVIANCGETSYMVRHLHAGPGVCEEPLARAVQDVHPDGQR